MSYSAMRKASPITKGEFLQMFQKCTPSAGWSSKVAVANSGGPDSTCLLFLINRLLSDDATTGKGLPTSVVSLTVDHGLQASSSAMAEHCSKIAASLNIQHLTAPIPWSTSPFPPLPSSTSAFENVARDARYHILFDSMTRLNTKTLAFGHHADDQVETSLMRLARGTTEVGAGGMRPCRRWGMGLGRSVEGRLGWAGHEGMRRWIVRPLLEASKDRILATCEENGLEYVTDKTNFQPEITLRNAIRHMLVEEEGFRIGLTPGTTSAEIPSEIKEQLGKIKDATESLRSVHYDITGGREQLRGAVKVLSSRVTDIENEVDRHLKRRTIPSPTGTFILSMHNLSAIRDDTVRSAMVMRILRYVSFQPWGSVRADGNRRRNSIQDIVNYIWTPDPQAHNIPFLVAGSGVLWRPVVIRGSADSNGRDRITVPKSNLASVSLKEGDRFGWLATRQPPYDKRIRYTPDGKQQEDPLHVDLTDTLNKAQQEGNTRQPLEILYDCRFILRFDLAKMPSDIRVSLAVGRSKILVEPRTRWYWPHVLWSRPGRPDDNIAMVQDAQEKHWVSPQLAEGEKSDWISIEFIRTLDAT